MDKNINIKLFWDNREAIAAIEKQKRSVKSTDKVAKKSEKVHTGVLKKIRMGYIMLAGVIIGIIGAAFVKVINKAKDFQEQNAKFGTVFRGVSKEANSMRRELVEAYGLSTMESTKFLASTQDLFVPLGIARDKAANLSSEVVKLARDIASFNNLPTDRVLSDIHSAMVGNVETVRKYGVVINQTAILEEARAKGIKITNGTIDAQQKALIIMNSITKGSADAIGDYQRTQDSLANTLKRIGAVAEDVQIILGQQLVKEIEPSISAFGRFASSEKGIVILTKSIKVLGLIFKAAWESTLKPTLLGFALLFSPIVDGIKLAVKSFMILKDSTLSAKEKLAALGEARKDSFQDLVNRAKNFAGEIIGDFKEMGEKLYDIFTSTEKLAIDGMNKIVEGTKEGNQEIVNSHQLTADQVKEIQKELNGIVREYDNNTTEKKIENLEILLEAIKLHSEQLLLNEEDKANAIAAIEDRIANLKKVKLDEEQAMSESVYKAISDAAEKLLGSACDTLIDSIASIGKGSEDMGKKFGKVIKAILLDLIKLILRLTFVKAIMSVIFPGSAALPSIPGMKEGGPVKKYQHGGKIPGYGGGDKVPALLEPGEYVLRKEAASKFFNLIDAINNAKFQTGGPVGSTASQAMVQKNYNITIKGEIIDDNAIIPLTKKIKRAIEDIEETGEAY